MTFMAKMGNANIPDIPYLHHTGVPFLTYDDGYPSPYKIEQGMWAMDALANQHGWVGYDSDHPLIGPSGFIWKRYNPNPEVFVPSSGGGQLIGYPWNIEQFWKDYFDVQSFVNDRLFLIHGKGYWESPEDYEPHKYFTKSHPNIINTPASSGNFYLSQHHYHPLRRISGPPIHSQPFIPLPDVHSVNYPPEPNYDVTKISEFGKLDRFMVGSGVPDFFPRTEVLSFQPNPYQLLPFVTYDVERRFDKSVGPDTDSPPYFSQDLINGLIAFVDSGFDNDEWHTEGTNSFRPEPVSSYSQITWSDVGLFGRIAMTCTKQQKFNYSLFPLSLQAVGVSSGNIYSMRSILGIESGVLGHVKRQTYIALDTFPNYDISNSYGGHKLVWGTVSNDNDWEVHVHAVRFNSSFSGQGLPGVSNLIGIIPRGVISGVYIGASGVTSIMNSMTNKILQKIEGGDYTEIHTHSTDTNTYSSDGNPLTSDVINVTSSGLYLDYTKLTEMLQYNDSTDNILFMAQFPEPFEDPPSLSLSPEELPDVGDGAYIKKNGYAGLDNRSIGIGQFPSGPQGVWGKQMLSSKYYYGRPTGQFFFGVDGPPFGMPEINTSGNFYIKR